MLRLLAAVAHRPAAVVPRGAPVQSRESRAALAADHAALAVVGKDTARAEVAAAAAAAGAGGRCRTGLLPPQPRDPVHQDSCRHREDIRSARAAAARAASGVALPLRLPPAQAQGRPS